ncbi:YicC/YloC family endoribonuclease [candidate division KSB1 bacterium]
MIKSMTGYGAAEVTEEGGRMAVEIRSLNHRFLDLNLRLPKSLVTLEPKLIELIRGKVARGRINLALTWEAAEAADLELNVDENLASGYLEAVNSLRDRFELPGEITLKDISRFPDVIRRQVKPVDPENFWSLVESASSAAMDGLAEMKAREGKTLDKELRQLIQTIGTALGLVEERAPDRVTEYRERLRKKIEESIEGFQLDQGRLEQEVAHMADRLDISEECARLRSHLDQFLNSLDRTEPVGRRLDFLLQEMLREANTIVSKANDSQITYHGLAIKEAAESLKEQVQNIE